MIPVAYRIEQKMNSSPPENPVQWLFLDLNAFFASCEQQENPALRGQPVIVVQTLTVSAVAIAASYAAKAFGIKTGTLTRDARRLCPAVIPVQANHRLYTEYHQRILRAVDTCIPVEKVCSIDEMACRLMGTERQVPVARETGPEGETGLARAGRRMPHLLDRPRAERLSRQGRVRSAEAGRADRHHP
jgi:DNA polymerase-4